MLPKKNRLKGNLTFEEVKKEGSMHQSRNFGLLVRKREDNQPTRFGFIVSTKISKKAVERNKIKRMLRDALRDKLDRIRKGYDAILLARSGLLKVKKDMLEKEIGKTLKEAGLL